MREREREGDLWLSVEDDADDDYNDDDYDDVSFLSCLLAGSLAYYCVLSVYWQKYALAHLLFPIHIFNVHGISIFFFVRFSSVFFSVNKLFIKKKK